VDEPTHFSWSTESALMLDAQISTRLCSDFY